MGRGSPQKTPRRPRAVPRSRWQRFLLRYGWVLPVAAILVGGGILLLTYAFASIPLPKDITLDASAEVYDRKGRLIGTFSGEVTRFLLDEQELNELPGYVGKAAIASEDRDFYDHNGVSFRGIIRAAWANVTGGEIQQGGSTITQQYVKNAVLHDPSRTITRKVNEAILAIKLERRFSKKEILGFYLNTIYLGRGAYGIEAAARAYFDKHAAELTLGEAAYLASIIPSPESYQPDENPRSARERRNYVLRQMVQDGQITDEEASRAARGKVKLATGAEITVKRQNAAYFLEWIRKEYLYPEFQDELYTGGLKIYTTLDLDVQRQAEESVSTILPNPDDPQAALVSMTSQGEVRALVGGRAFTNVRRARGFNYAVDLPGRQAGSAFKPFTLLAAIEEEISPQSTFSGASPRLITDPDCATPDPVTEALEPWEVENFGGSSYGTVTLDQATTNSINTVYAQLVSEIGPDNLVDVLDGFQFDREGASGERRISADCSLSLGVLDVTPLEMARAYAGLAARGRLPEVSPILYVTSKTDGGEVCIKEYRPNKQDCEEEGRDRSEQVVEQNSADVLNQTLTHVVEGGTGTAANIGRPVAGKTGTTQNHANAWFAGYTPQLATVVWMGYPIDPGPDKKLGAKKNCGAAPTGCTDDFTPLMEFCSDLELCRPVVGDLGYPIEVTGGSFPARIWQSFMLEAMEGTPIEEFPEPVDLPDEVLNSPAPAATYTGAPDETAVPTAEPTDDDDGSPAPSSPAPSDSPPPSVVPSGEPSSSPSPREKGKGKPRP